MLAIRAGAYRFTSAVSGARHLLEDPDLGKRSLRAFLDLAHFPTENGNMAAPMPTNHVTECGQFSTESSACFAINFVDDFVDELIFHCLNGGHEAIPIGIGFDFFQRLPCMFE